MTEQWLEDHMGLLTNHYIQFMQVPGTDWFKVTYFEVNMFNRIVQKRLVWKIK